METNVNKDSGSILDIVKIPFCSITVLVAFIIIAVLLCRGIVQFRWVYIMAPKLFWSIFLTAWLWDVYFYAVCWIIILLKAVKK